jgi:hypothetical protein
MDNETRTMTCHTNDMAEMECLRLNALLNSTTTISTAATKYHIQPYNIMSNVQCNQQESKRACNWCIICGSVSIGGAPSSTLRGNGLPSNCHA